VQRPLSLQQLDRYVARIGYRGPRDPTLGTLRALHRAHLLAIPYENLDIHLGRQLTLDPEAMFTKLVDERRGGWCYEMNGLLGRVLETLGFDVHKVVSGFGTAPVATLSKNDLRGIGRTNDCILYGGQAHYTIRASDDELTTLAASLPATASKDYGVPFYDIFQRYDRDFYKIDPLLFSPAEVWLTSAESGRSFHGGKLAPDILAASLYPA